jgi:hypothetical protein
VLVAAAVCPHPPVLVPALAAGAAPELDGLRAGCVAAVEALHASRPQMLFVVGVDGGATGTTFGPWGVGEPVDVPEPLPLSLLVGAWLTRGRDRSFVAVDDQLDAVECAELGGELADAAGRTALLVMGDGCARHTEKAPGYLDPRAAAYDDEVARALAAGDADALLALDPDEARDLMVAGRAPWQVLAGACVAAGQPQVDDPLYAAPYGVGYHVVTWTWPDRT